ncbi:MAG: hypothetical protein GKR96_04855 [Gammaproteobacteria bacterium]|nr:hypothetical protein [Gammaproteobacteria bacterium]
MVFQSDVLIAKIPNKLFLIFTCCLSLAMTACTSGDSATTSGGASFTNIAGNWTGTVTPADSSSPTFLSLSIVFTSGDIINGVANFSNDHSNCLASGTLTGTAASGLTTFVITSNVSTATFAGTASTNHMQGTFVAADTSSTLSDASTTNTSSGTPCSGVSGNWKASR